VRDIAIPGSGSSANRYRGVTRAAQLLLPVVVLAVFVVAWQVAIRAFHVQPFIMPPPSAIWSSFASQPSLFLTFGWNTTKEALSGLAISLATGVPIAALVFKRPGLVALTKTYSAALIAMPVVAVIPLANVYFGFTPSARVFVVVVATAPIIVIYTVSGLAGTDPGLVDCFRSCAAKPFKMLWGVYLPSALPSLMSGLRVAVPTTFAVAIIAEFFGGTLNTLGTFIKSAALQSHVADLWGASLTAFLFAIVLFAIVIAADTLLMGRRRGTA
jgi:ABC-type nitrate/sulfonate/bicarbonate transport system permease component